MTPNQSLHPTTALVEKWGRVFQYLTSRIQNSLPTENVLMVQQLLRIGNEAGAACHVE